MPFLFNRGLVLVGIESTFDTDPGLSASTDALLVAEPSFDPDFTILERDNVRNSLSNDPVVVGRKLARVTFRHEVRNNGNTDGTVSAIIGRLLRACGMQETQINTAAECLVSVTAASGNTGDLNFTCTTAMTQPLVREFDVHIVSGGGSGAAVAQIVAEAEGGHAAVDLTGTEERTLTDGVEISLDDTGGTTLAGITPDFQSNNPATGDVYTVKLQPLGYKYLPRSENFESVTLYIYEPDDTGQAILKKMTGCRGTWSMEAPGGDYARFSFDFMGSYVAPTDVAMPTPTYETQKPQQVELSNLYIKTASGARQTLGGCSRFTLDIGNEVIPRPDINESDAYNGAEIVDRSPVAGFDPEVVLQSVFGVWDQAANGTELEWGARVGNTKGNTVIFEAPNIQWTQIENQNRDSIRTYNLQAPLAQSASTGDDEMSIIFC